MLFATNRVLEQGTTPFKSNRDSFQLPRKVSFNLDNNQAEQSIYFCTKEEDNQYTEIGSTKFFELLASSKAQDIVFYIHGYSNLPSEHIFPRALELQQLFDDAQEDQVLVVPLIWPCDNDLGALVDYFDDQLAADASDIAFMRFFEKFFKWLSSQLEDNPIASQPFNKDIHVLTHSMGARVLNGAINRAVQYFQLNGFPLVFRNIFLSAPDLVNEIFEPLAEGRWIPASARNVIVYYASDDWALRASKVLNLRNLIASRRLGQTGPEDMSKVPDNVFALDCGDFNGDYDPAGHAYFASDREGEAGLLFRHMRQVINSGRVSTRNGNKKAILDSSFISNT